MEEKHGQPAKARDHVGSGTTLIVPELMSKRQQHQVGGDR